MSFLRRRWKVILIAFCFVLAGCTATRNAIEGYQLSQKDPALVQQVMLESNDISVMARGVAMAFPGTAPYSELIGQLAGMIASFVIGAKMGARKKKEEV